MGAGRRRGIRVRRAQHGPAAPWRGPRPALLHTSHSPIIVLLICDFSITSTGKCYLTPKDFLRIRSHREILCLAIQHDKGPSRRFRWSGAWSSVSTQSAPGGTRTPNLLIRNTRRGQTSGPEVPPRDGDRWLASGHEGRGWGQVGVSSIIRRWVHPVGSQRRREAQNEALRLTGQTARRPDKEKIS